MTTNRRARSSAVLAAVAMAVASLAMAGSARAQITLPYNNGFESTAATTFATPQPRIAGATDFGYFPNSESGGAWDNTIGAGSNYTFYGDGLRFNVTPAAGVILNGVFVYPSAAGNVTVRLLNSSSVVLATATTAVATTGVKTYIPLNFTIAQGTGFQLDATGTTVASMFRNTAGAVYPYTNAGVSITSAINNLAGFYYFFYDWQINAGTVAAPAVQGNGSTDTVFQSGVRAFTMDKATCTVVDTQNYLILTLNMTNYTTATPINLTFGLREDGDEPDPNDRVWIRGRSTNPWILAGDLGTLTPMSGQFYNITIAASTLLVANAQQYTATFQVRWGQQDDCFWNSDGYTFDNVGMAIAQVCGNGQVEGTETCDDMNVMSSDGCSATCAVETGWTCMGMPSICSPICGDGLIVGMEACDDGDLMSLDGCSATCTVETGWMCTGMPSICTSTCGDGIVAVGAETCDDMNTMNMDGCSSTCTVETGYTCMGSPSICTSTCGDGVIAVGDRDCDDGNTVNGDGCSMVCTLEPGWMCTGTPSVCTTTCGDGIIAGTEVCDDGNTTSGDGCDSMCAVEPGFGCMGEPSVCDGICGDGMTLGTEQCDDGNTTAGDGCDATCAEEMGFTCVGDPSVCTTTCGDNIVAGMEECDDGNTTAGDGCDAMCNTEAGMGGAGPGPSTTGTGTGTGSGAGGSSGDGADEGGCGCRTLGSRNTGRYGVAALALLGLALSRRRRRAAA